MTLDRQSIERKDFPVGRRGYDPQAVDAHLSALADEIDDFKRSARQRNDTLASSASERVRAIVEAAESSAADIQRVAEDDAREIRDDAAREAQVTREQAADQARQHVDKLSESTHNMVKRLEAMESEFAALIESLRTGSNRIEADLKLLQGNLAEVSAATLPRHDFEPETGAGAEPETAAGAEPETAAVPKTTAGGDAEAAVTRVQVAEAAGERGERGAGRSDVDGVDPRAPGQAATPEDATAPDDAGAPGGAGTTDDPGTDDDAEGARLIALNMALDGSPREETERYLTANFKLADRDSLLDEVYASVQG